jgi:hypothetical protein
MKNLGTNIENVDGNPIEYSGINCEKGDGNPIKMKLPWDLSGICS